MVKKRLASLEAIWEAKRIPFAVLPTMAVPFHGGDVKELHLARILIFSSPT
jgi:hypothetical protein